MYMLQKLYYELKNKLMQERYKQKESAYIRRIENTECSNAEKIEIISKLIERKSMKVLEIA
jgi:hypothetical protein